MIATPERKTERAIISYSFARMRQTVARVAPHHAAGFLNLIGLLMGVAGCTLPTTRRCYPQQPPDLASGLTPEGVDRNFCRQWSLQK